MQCQTYPRHSNKSNISFVKIVALILFKGTKSFTMKKEIEQISLLVSRLPFPNW